LIQLKNQLQYGSLRKNPDNGMSDYTIVGNEAVKHCLEALRPHLKMKKRQATLLLQIIKQSQKKEEPEAFLTRCKLVDQVSRLNDSKGRKITSDTVRSSLLELNLLSVPVETQIPHVDGLQPNDGRDRMVTLMSYHNTPTPPNLRFEG
jgi:hypothetical protein